MSFDALLVRCGLNNASVALFKSLSGVDEAVHMLRLSVSDVDDIVRHIKKAAVKNVDIEIPVVASHNLHGALMCMHGARDEGLMVDANYFNGDDILKWTNHYLQLVEDGTDVLSNNASHQSVDIKFTSWKDFQS